MKGSQIISIYEDNLKRMANIERELREVNIGSITANYNMTGSSRTGFKKDKIGDLVAAMEKRDKKLLKSYEALKEENKGIWLIFEELSDKARLILFYKFNLNYKDEAIQEILGIKNISAAYRDIESELNFKIGAIN